jgi:hypothetical protein
MLDFIKRHVQNAKNYRKLLLKNQKNQCPNVAKTFPKKFIKFWQSFDKLLLLYNF